MDTNNLFKYINRVKQWLLASDYLGKKKYGILNLPNQTDLSSTVTVLPVIHERLQRRRPTAFRTQECLQSVMVTN